MTALLDIMDALATQISSELCGTASPAIPNLQVLGRLNMNPTPPSIDIYPADPFQEGIGFGPANNDLHLIVRARVTTADNYDGQNLLLTMMDPDASTSIADAVAADPTLGGTVDDAAVVEGPSGFGVFPDSGGGGNLLGATWTVTVTP